MLASIQEILNITPIEGADNIETAQILGWEVVVKKGQFKVGDLCCYIQIDTLVPDIPFFKFLEERKYRVRTIKLRKQLSQGLIISKDDIIQIGNQLGKLKYPQFLEGKDFTEFLNIKKYSKEIVEVESKKKPKNWRQKYWWIFKEKVLWRLFPSWKKVNIARFPTDIVSITDEERIQNIPKVLKQFRGKEFIVSEKLDGSSITMIYDVKKKKFRICSRKLELFNKTNEWYKVFEKTNFKEHLINLSIYYPDAKIIVVQGEYIGKPQGNPYKLTSDEIRAFNIDIDSKRLLQGDFYKLCEILYIPACPRLDNLVLDHSMSELLKLGEGKSLLNPSVEREGVVLREVNKSISFKVISNKFLLKNNE